MVPRFRDRCADCAPLPESASRLDESDDLPKQPRRSQQPAVHVFFFVATLEIGMPECARLGKHARAVEADVSRDENLNVANHPDAKRSDVFFFVRLTPGAQPRRFPRDADAVGCNPT